MMLEFIAQNTQSKNKENCEIEVTAEEWGWHSNTAIEPSNFLKDHARITLDNIQRRDGGNFLIDIPPPLAKKDHPFLNYADAIGFLVGDDSIPNMLEEYKEKLNQFIHVLPIYPTFLESEFPKLCEDLATKPLKFIEALIETNTQHVNAYFKFVLSGMILTLRSGSVSSCSGSVMELYLILSRASEELEMSSLRKISLLE